MNIARKYALFKIILFGHILNPFWKTRIERRKRRTDLTAKVVTKYFQRYLKAAENIPETVPIKDDKNDKIWTLWLQGEDKAPALVKACYRSVRKHCKQKLIVLDADTVFDYISLPKEIVEKYKAGKIGHAHFADICRVELLYRHGGYWLDSTGFVTAPIPDWIEEQDFFVYLTGDNYKVHVDVVAFFHNGEGIHDASWRSRFGGTIYKYSTRIFINQTNHLYEFSCEVTRVHSDRTCRWRLPRLLLSQESGA